MKSYVTKPKLRFLYFVLPLFSTLFLSCTDVRPRVEVKKEINYDSIKSGINVKDVNKDFKITFNLLILSLKGKNKKLFKDLSFTKLELGSELLENDKFFAKIQSYDFLEHFYNRIIDSSKIEVFDSKAFLTYYPNLIVKEGATISNYQLHTIDIQIGMADNIMESPRTIRFEFIETKTGYKLFGFDIFG